MMRYTVYRAAGWHGGPSDPVILRTDDEEEAALRAGCRADLGHPGGCNPYDSYAEDEGGNEISRIESYQCDECEEIIPWGEAGPWGAKDGCILDCPEAAEGHLVTWLCGDCAADYEEDE